MSLCCRWSKSECYDVVVWFGGDVKVFLEG